MMTLPKMTLPRNRQALPPPTTARRSPAPLPQHLERKSAPGGREIRSFALAIKATGADGSIEGYGSVFGVVDAYDDVISAGAFAVSLAAHKAAGTLPAMLWQHESSEPLGVWTEMTEDANGLYVKGKLCLETDAGKDAHALLKMGAINGLSIGFISKQWLYDNETDIRTLTEIDLWEVSLVTFPANEKARVTNIKSSEIGGMKTVRQAEKALRDAGFSQDAAKAFVAGVKRIAIDERDAHEASAAALKSARRLISSLTS